MKKEDPLIFAHIGDLHIKNAKEQNYIDFLSIVAQIETNLNSKLDFVFLPGDNADNGLPEQYQLIATALKMLSIPTYILAGDHDMEQGNLDNFYRYLPANHLPFSTSIRGNRCLFLDVNGTGKGGPDFRLGESQFLWLEKELVTAADKAESIIIFVHAYPSDLVDDGEKQRLKDLITKHQVLLIDTGHTHYNDLINNDKTILAATRSTGQIEEGPVGYSVISVDDGTVSWRFKMLEEAFPFVVITSPADYRLSGKGQLSEQIIVRAVVFSNRRIKAVKWRFDNQDWEAMQEEDNDKCWTTTIHPNFPKNCLLTVEAIDETGRPGRHSIQIFSFENDSDRAAKIDAWPENGILGTRLGPNANARPS